MATKVKGNYRYQAYEAGCLSQAYETRTIAEAKLTAVQLASHAKRPVYVFDKRNGVTVATYAPVEC